MLYLRGSKQNNNHRLLTWIRGSTMILLLQTRGSKHYNNYTLLPQIRGSKMKNYKSRSNTL
jgi:hypothetical protein